MKRSLGVFVVVLVGVGILGCGMAPEHEAATPIEKVVVYAQDFNTVWNAIIYVFANFDIPIAQIEKDSGLISSNDVKLDREWIHAPEDTLDWRITDAYGTFNVWVLQEEAGCRVSVNTTFYGEVRRYNCLLATVWYTDEQFASSGIFEEKLHSHLLGQLTEPEV